MRKLWLPILIIAALATAAAYVARQGVQEATAEPAIQWTTGTFDDLLAQARSAQMPVMIDFYATWCGPCKRLARETYADEQVAAYAGRHLVCAKRDAEQDEGLELARRYFVYNYPTILFLNPDGTEIDRQVGFLPPADYLQLMQDYVAGTNTYDDYLRRVQASPDDLELNYVVGEKMTHRLLRDESHRYLDKVLALDPENRNGYAVEALFALAELHRKLATANPNEQDWQQAVAYARRAIDTDPSEANTRAGLNRIAYYEKKAGNVAGAAGIYRELIGLAPRDPAALNAFAWFCAKQRYALEEATETAQRAVQLSDGEPGIIDTLAEVYYARGMFDEAIGAIQQAIAKDDDSYFKQQLEKFEQARGAQAGL